ncbi:tripartite ATP-independent periplasmic transporters, DctQ component [Roseovarius sp. A-2]|uniref:TRAP transporter small permease n=1 Tax=Roseovarius sp. A-2 TaxID=1570360 RepID=UPI0009B59292|nr:TRAP transporter small permease subunit [Roseovarius sp. A-2]GAW37161.1 tripartite ATP-independent periplasmic transporters, DctQ component [Roseovarius sp. A-2]
MIFWKLYDWIELTVGLLALAATVAAVLVAAVGRSLGMPVTSAPQFAQLFLIWTVMFGADLAMKSGAHIRVSALVDQAPPRLQAALAAIHAAMILGFLGFISLLGWQLSMSNWQRELGASGLSYGLVTLAVPAGAALLIVSLLRRLVGQGFLGAITSDGDESEELL